MKPVAPWVAPGAKPVEAPPEKFEIGRKPVEKLGCPIVG